MTNASAHTTATTPETPGPSRSQVMGRRLIKGAALLLVWVILSGKFDAFHVGVGVLSVGLAVWLDSRMPSLSRGGVWPRIRPWRWLCYYLWLLAQMLQAAVYVATVVIRPGAHLEPRLVRFRCQQPNAVAAVTLANSITLTPGTLTVSMEDDIYLVHALSERTAQDLLNGEMQARVAWVFGDMDPPKVEELPVEEEAA